jgi:DNA-binding beta-propeller fold protein YncE
MRARKGTFPRRAATGTALVLAAVVLVVGIASAATGDLTFKNCFADTNAAGCSVPSKAVLGQALGVAASPDGNSVYVTSGDDDAVSTFARDPATGDLTFQDCFAQTAVDGCQVPGHAALTQLDHVAVSPDNKSVYVTSETNGAISHFSRNTSTGALTFVGCFADAGAGGCTTPSPAALNEAEGVTVSPDGKSVYVAALGDNAVSHFSRDPATGNLTFKSCVANGVVGCATPTPPSLGGANAVAVSPDNKSVYVAAIGDDSVSTFSRDSAGDLSSQGCFADTGPPCSVPADPALDGATDVAASPDGKSVYVASFFDESISSFSRDSAGSLSFQGCFAETSAEGCAVPASAALNGANGVAVSPDGASVYVAANQDNAISGFNRDTAGNLSFEQCFADAPGLGCAVPAQAALDGAYTPIVSPDNTSVYITSETDNAVSHFSREPLPAPPPTGAPPSNAFSFGKLKRNKRKGTATLTVNVPGPGTLGLTGKGLVKQRVSGAANAVRATAKAVSAAGAVKLKIKAKGRAKHKLNNTGNVKLTARITFTPTGGSPNTKSKKLKLIKRKH